MFVVLNMIYKTLLLLDTVFLDRYLMPHVLVHSIWPFALRNIGLFALRPIQFLLCSIEGVEILAEGILQGSDLASRMQHLPRMGAFSGFASLEHDE